MALYELRVAHGAAGANINPVKIVCQHRLSLFGLEPIRNCLGLGNYTGDPCSTGPTVTVTEQGTFFDGYDDAGSRERGTGFLLDKLGATLG